MYYFNGELKVEQLAMTKAPVRMQYPYIDSHLKLTLSLNKASDLFLQWGVPEQNWTKTLFGYR